MLKKKKFSQSGWYLYLVPALFFYTIFMAYPLIGSIRLSFFKTTGGEYSFAGLYNYINLFTNDEYSTRFWGAFKNTWYFFFIHMLVQNCLAVTFALMLTERTMKYSRVYQTIIFIPVTFAVLVTGYLWKLLLNPQWGAFAVVLNSLGFDFLVYPWLGEQNTALTAVSLVSTWQWMGIPTMMFYAALQGISDDIMEASELEGTSKLQRTFYIRLPLILPIIGIVSVLTFVNNFNAFDVVFAMENANGAPQYSTDIMGTLFYRVGIAGQHPVGIPNPGLGAAIATVTFLLLLAGALLILKFTQKNK
ncbi:sugar ABC transporter permease [Treponema phagedenis]|uniref:ABC transporter, permease protein n=1 Tax=Treponema phagedenis TaxID=162 RepID=A0A0B7GUF7_TREPH|nr:sugar ABC transporter permease [Treponema phagedenis]EFW36962.1 ABC transporter, permease protein [Treponema phagedenis F0421]NVP24235.1 sugar ABC transporter permease [Treponema phagedenis]QEJ94210.1 sugar ABC transporter permease [Treponema phagedenis]QEJ99204.1 sugar ABC transporter permease [Treponema phagedenis]QEK00169.1 sugar ABC transporter permease [Treponema phagedenis]